MAYSLSPWLKPRFFITGTNRPLAGGLMYTYKAGTTENATTYSDDAGTTNTNPIQLDSDGQCDLYLDDSVSYRIILKNSAGVTQFDRDRVASIGSTQVQSVNNIASLRLKTGTTTANSAVTLGYYSPADGGGNSFYWDSTSTATDNGGTIIKPTSVSGAGRWIAVDKEISLFRLGAVGNNNYYPVSDWYTVESARYRGFANLAAVQAVYPHVTASTDSVDFAAIQAAIDASYDKDLVIPTGSYYLRAARADKILNIGNRINIIGSYGTNFIISSYTPNTQDVIQINPLTIADEGVELHNIWVYEQSGSTPARDILRVNLDLTHGLKKLRLFGCLFRTLNGSGRAVRILNPANVNANGLFSTNIERNEFSGGLFAEGLGDSVRIKDNTFAGKNIGIDIAMMPFDAINSATAKLSIKDNNITSEGGAIVIRNGFCITIADNNIEQLVDLTTGACIRLYDLDVVSGKSVIMNNKIQPTDPTSKCNGISLNNCKNTAVVNNQIGTSAKAGSYTGAVLVNACENVQVHYNDSYVSDGCFGVLIDAGSKNTSYKKGKIRPVNSNFTEIENASTSTSGYRIFASLLNSWVVAGAGQFQQAQFTKNDGVVSLDGVIARAMTTGDHLIMTLPVGMRPALRVMAICYAYYADGSVGFCNVRVDPDGSVYLSKRSHTTLDIVELSLNGINFNAADA